ncbi:MAG: hypothetical protein NVS3B10_27390 [Polyangiales bacterium]
MTGVAVPRAERSGSHRVVEVELGDVRQRIAAIAGVGTLARAQGVGPKALRDALPELRAACTSAPAAVAHALLPACDVVALSTGLTEEARAVVDALVGATRVASNAVLAAIDAGERKGIGARTRLTLQAACEEAVEVLTRVRWAVELLQRASLGEPVVVALDDLLRELDAGELGGTEVEVGPCGALDASVAVQPRVATAVLLAAVAHLHSTTHARRYVLEASLTDRRVRLEVRPGEPRSSFVVRARVPPPAPYDALVLRLTAATLAAPLTLGESSVVVELQAP